MTSVERDAAGIVADARPRGVGWSSLSHRAAATAGLYAVLLGNGCAPAAPEESDANASANRSRTVRTRQIGRAYRYDDQDDLENQDSSSSTEGAEDLGEADGQYDSDSPADLNADGRSSTESAVDWAALPLVAENSDTRNPLRLKADIRDDRLLVRVESARLDPTQTFLLFLDTDNDRTSGYKTGDWLASSGADYMITRGDTKAWRYSGQNYEYSWEVTSVDVTQEAVDTALHFSIALSAMAVLSDDREIALGFEWQVNNRKEISVPAQPAFAHIAPPNKPRYDYENCRYADEILPAPEIAPPVCPSACREMPRRTDTSPIPVGKGMIIPAYLEPGDAGWTLLQQSEQAIADSGRSIDHWVVLNGPGSRPPEEGWEPRRRDWDALSRSRLFGYVHTCESKDGVTTGKYRPSAELAAEIATWACCYPALSGIWLDEFVPRYELTDRTDGVIFPDLNNLEAAPTSRCFLDWQGNLITGTDQQVNPKGGFYHRLIAWIRQHYPWMRVIGNPGAPLENIQHAYGDLVDVLAAYENNPATRPIASPITGTRAAQLALLHSVTSEEAMMAAVLDALQKQYTHVYATSGLYATSGSEGTGNPWGVIPTYIASEASYLASQLGVTSNTP